MVQNIIVIEMGILGFMYNNLFLYIYKYIWIKIQV
jgi:hypothetical protein